MRNLNVRSWNDWENLCTYWMTDIARTQFGIVTNYAVYGTTGQSQYGVDIIPEHSGVSVVGQSKYVRRFAYQDLLVELKKTDRYPNPLTDYFLLTTAEHCTSIQNESAKSPITHTRPNGDLVRVHFKYWVDQSNIHFLPSDVQRMLFSEAHLTFSPQVIQQPQFSALTPDVNEQRNKLSQLKNVLRATLSNATLVWLEQWNFRSCYLIDSDVQELNDLWFAWRDAKSANEARTPEMAAYFLNTQLKCDIYATIPASNSFFQALDDFRSAINSHCIGATSPEGEYLLSIIDFPTKQSIAMQWESCAHYLVQQYRNAMS